MAGLPTLVNLPMRLDPLVMLANLLASRGHFLPRQSIALITLIAHAGLWPRVVRVDLSAGNNARYFFVR